MNSEVIDLERARGAQAELERKLDALAGQDVRPIQADELEGLLMMAKADDRDELLEYVNAAKAGMKAKAKGKGKPKAVAKAKGGESDAQLMVAFRLAPDLIKRLDAHAARLTEQMPGASFTRTDVVRMLLLKGLEEAEEKRAKR